MSVKIRLTRIGRHDDPVYRVVVADSRVARDGRFIEQIGQYNPSIGAASFVIDEEKVLKWLGQGAIPSDTIKFLLSSKGIMAKFAESKVKHSEKKPVAKKTVKKEEKTAEVKGE